MEKKFIPTTENRYTSPTRSVKEIQIKDGDKVVGNLEYIEFNDKIKFYYLVIMLVSVDYRNQRIGSKMMELFTEKLRESDTLGISLNVMDDDDPAKNISYKYGWKDVPGHKNYRYFSTSEVSQDQLDLAIKFISNELI